MIDTMIRAHAFNTAWWGAPVGIVENDAFATASESERRAALAPWEWVELRAPLATSPAGAALAALGFWQADVQIEFRIPLAKVLPSASAAALTLHAFDDTWAPLRFADFAAERYLQLRGAALPAIHERYARWARALCAADPSWCVEARLDGVAQGWFFAEPSEKKGLRLTLAVLDREARISGALLYQAALAHYGARGQSVGWAGFSVRNTAVHNIYARLGATFTAPEGVWLWQRSV